MLKPLIDPLENRLKKINLNVNGHKKHMSEMSGFSNQDITTTIYNSSAGLTARNQTSRFFVSDDFRRPIDEFFSKKIFIQKKKKLERIPKKKSFEFFTFVPSKKKKELRSLSEMLPEKERKNILKHKNKKLKLSSITDLISRLNGNITKSIMQKQVENIEIKIPFDVKSEVEKILKEERTLRRRTPKKTCHQELKLIERDKYNTINSRISFPYLINDNVLMSEIYTQNFNYHKQYLKQQFSLKK